MIGTRLRSISMSKSYLYRKKKAVVLGALLITLLSLACLLSHFQIGSASHGVDDSVLYDIVLDAGSSGSRIHVFVFKQFGNDLQLRSEYFKRVQPGLSSYASNVSGAIDSLRPLLDVAISSVPESSHRSTAITLKATAGLRLLPEEQQVSLLSAVDSYLNSTPFSNRGVSVISGSEEAVYGWMTLNYLLGRFHSRNKPPIVAIDMGGASTQIVFRTPSESAEWLPFRYALHLNIKGDGITLYHHSYLGFGLNEARKSIQKSYDRDQILVCLPNESSHASQNGSAPQGNTTAQNFASCTELVQKAMFSEETCKYASCGAQGIPQPSIDAGGHDIYTFSYFYDLLQRVMPVDSPLVVEHIKEAGQRVCDNPEHPENKDSVCLDLAYLYSYLHHGLKLKNTTRVHVANEIQGQSLSWPLGDSLSYLWKAVITQY